MRLLIQLQEGIPAMASRAAPPPLPEAVRRLLDDAGATHVRASHPELVGLITAEVPDGAGVDELVAQLQALPEVRHAELDSFSTTL